MNVHDATIPPISVGLKKAAVLTGLSERALRYYVGAGRLRVCRAGKKLLIPVDSLREFVQTPKHPGPTEHQEEKAQGQS